MLKAELVYHHPAQPNAEAPNSLKVSCTVQPVRFVLVPAFVQTISKFFQPVVEPQSLKEFELAIFMQLQEAKSGARDRLRRILSQSQIPIDLYAHIAAPYILLPQFVTLPESQLLIFSLGDLSVKKLLFAGPDPVVLSPDEIAAIP